MQNPAELEELYVKNHERMFKVNKHFRAYLIGMGIIAVLFFVFTLFAGAQQAKSADNQGPAKFYNAMNSGAFQVLAAIATAVTGYLTATKLKAAMYAAMGAFVVEICTLFFAKGIGMSGGNLALCITGLALNAWVMRDFSELDDLKNQPGYPLFSMNADNHAEYEAPLYVTARRAEASSEMGSVGVPQAVSDSPAVSLNKAPAPNTANIRLAEMSGVEIPQRPVTVLQKPVAVQLEDLTAQSNAPAQAIPDLPQMSADALLGDMTPAAQHRQYHPDETALPSPEEVRARLAAMKQAQEN